MTETKSKSFAARVGDANWLKGLRPYFVYRDLGMKNATQGRVMAHVIRADQACDGPMGYHSHDLEFQMNYLLKGWARIDLEDVGEIQVTAGDAWYQAPGVKHELLEFSEDFEVIEITIPGDFPTVDETR
tara:strand:- start:367 stop:753 length:387 start_codon:yes stop_codon:yes gene_type:complete